MEIFLPEAFRQQKSAGSPLPESKSRHRTEWKGREYGLTCERPFATMDATGRSLFYIQRRFMAKGTKTRIPDVSRIIVAPADALVIFFSRQNVRFDGDR